MLFSQARHVVRPARRLVRVVGLLFGARVMSLCLRSRLAFRLLQSFSGMELHFWHLMRIISLALR